MTNTSIEERLAGAPPELLAGNERAQMALVAAVHDWVSRCGGCSCEYCANLLAADRAIKLVAAAILESAGVTLDEIGPIAVKAWNEDIVRWSSELEAEQ